MEGTVGQEVGEGKLMSTNWMHAVTKELNVM